MINEPEYEHKIRERKGEKYRKEGIQQRINLTIPRACLAVSRTSGEDAGRKGRTGQDEAG
jgi:hypothetical protein